MATSEERELLKACFSGDRAAWERFVQAYSKLVYYSIHQTFKARGINPASDEVDDLYGSIFLSLFENDFSRLKSFRGKNDCTLASWIRLISSRKTYDFLREKARRTKIIEFGGQIAEDHPSAENIEDTALANERARLAREALAELNPDELAFLHLYYEKGLTPEKIAEILGVTVSTVYSKKNRVREKLRKIVEERP